MPSVKMNIISKFCQNTNGYDCMETPYWQRFVTILCFWAELCGTLLPKRLQTSYLICLRTAELRTWSFGT